jgi:hypothetical protein
VYYVEIPATSIYLNLFQIIYCWITLGSIG